LTAKKANTRRKLPTPLRKPSLTILAMGNYTLETGKYIYRLSCECCLTEKNRVWGFVSKDGDAHALYYALLNLEEKCPRVGLTLGVGPWWEGTDPSQRVWLHVNVCAGERGIEMGIRDPQESNFYPWPKGGTPLDREAALASSAIEEIWSVADFIVATDVAVSSYLSGKAVNGEGREPRNHDGLNRGC
jgi:hypothetical protein